MKQYTKPTAAIVELAVKENIAGLPEAIVTTHDITVFGQATQLVLTTYNLAAQQTSNNVQG